MTTMTDDRVRIHGILGSTRQGRFGETVATWLAEIAAERDDLVYQPVDLRDWPLPFFDSPRSPASGHVAPEAEAWSRTIAAADGYVLITPEYNRGYPAVLKNALDHLWHEWNHKPVGFVGYGGASGGTRATAQLRQVALELELVPVRVEVVLASARSQFDEKGRIRDDRHARTAHQMLDQVVRMAQALRPLRAASVG